MQSFLFYNVNHALPRALAALRDTGLRIAPRGQPTLELVGPVATTYAAPTQMVLFDPVRDANPFFHFFEALWILAGRNDVKFLAHFNSRMADYSDNGETFHAPYGYRLRHVWPEDQIELAISKLSSDRDSRQAVLQIWDPRQDWERTKDVPCNDVLMFKVRDGKLRMTVCNRSNDVVWGAYGANVVQFSTLLVYMARRIGVGVGTYTQVSDSFHVYEDNPYWQAWLKNHPSGVPPVMTDYYNDLGYYLDMSRDTKWMRQEDFMAGNVFDADLKEFFAAWDNGESIVGGYASESFNEVVVPMYESYRLWKAKQHVAALGTCARIEAPDWRVACREWMMRRYEKITAEAAAA